MKPLNLRVVSAALAAFGAITFTLCLLWGLVFPSFTMVAIWKVLLPGFQGIGWGSYLLGLVEIALYGLYTAAIFVPLYNWLVRNLTGQPMTGGMHHV